MGCLESLGCHGAVISSSAARNLDARWGEEPGLYDFSDEGLFGSRYFGRGVAFTGWEMLRSEGIGLFDRSQQTGCVKMNGEVARRRGGSCGFGAGLGFVNLSSGLIVLKSDLELWLRVCWLLPSGRWTGTWRTFTTCPGR